VHLLPAPGELAGGQGVDSSFADSSFFARMLP
jgi:hypothetical protein